MQERIQELTPPKPRLGPSDNPQFVDNFCLDQPLSSSQTSPDWFLSAPQVQETCLSADRLDLELGSPKRNHKQMLGMSPMSRPLFGKLQRLDKVPGKKRHMESQ